MWICGLGDCVGSRFGCLVFDLRLGVMEFGCMVVVILDLSLELVELRKGCYLWFEVFL